MTVPTDLQIVAEVHEEVVCKSCGCNLFDDDVKWTWGPYCDACLVCSKCGDDMTPDELEDLGHCRDCDPRGLETS